MRRTKRSAALAALLLVAAAVRAGEVDVLQVDIRPAATPGQFDIAVTLRHADSGWDHYANRWEILGPTGEVLATRTLQHPHVDEQPFTRSLNGIALPANLTWIRVRGHDLVHGYGGREVTRGIPLP
jgi:hypothetical protein